MKNKKYAKCMIKIVRFPKKNVIVCSGERDLNDKLSFDVNELPSFDTNVNSGL